MITVDKIIFKVAASVQQLQPQTERNRSCDLPNSCSCFGASLLLLAEPGDNMLLSLRGIHELTNPLKRRHFISDLQSNFLYLVASSFQFRNDWSMNVPKTSGTSHISISRNIQSYVQIDARVLTKSRGLLAFFHPTNSPNLDWSWATPQLSPTWSTKLAPLLLAFSVSGTLTLCTAMTGCRLHSMFNTFLTFLTCFGNYVYIHWHLHYPEIIVCFLLQFYLFHTDIFCWEWVSPKISPDISLQLRWRMRWRSLTGRRPVIEKKS